jgi:hypothetical protein
VDARPAFVGPRAPADGRSRSRIAFVRVEAHAADLPEGNSVRKAFLIAVLAIVTCVFSVGATAEAAAPDGPRTERGQLVHRIVMKWGGHVREAYRTDVGTWAMNMVPVFARVPLSTLERAAQADTFERMNDALLGTAPVAAAGPMPTASDTPQKTFGDSDRDLLFVPVTPCRIIDTRVAGGAIAANTTRAFDVTAVADYSFQGGASGNCGGAGSAGSYAAAAINFTVVTPSAAGYITAFPFGAAQPLAATVNYTAGDIRGNFAVVRLDQSAASNEMSVYSFAQTHLVADIVGYFINPGPLVFECEETAEVSVTIAAGASDDAFAPACAAGYTQTGTNCRSTSYLVPFVWIANGACSARNNSGGSATIRASRTCCRARRT